ncbi:hypothetical protein GCM10025883_16470 [Mobilicoccus caccae]|uniref:ABC transmembrane type-1 domain-containing protein n=1 Tax=Mobilicoccus caccae TaxID=1859295 RepID=A0ABQ6IQX3_9MICO|nr:hypothetical protein GCM10025883_16470 [Mobilicoccus caccae]
MLSAEENRESRRRSMRLLGTLLSPVRGRVGVLAVMVIVAQLAVVAGPAIIAWGIDNALPALLAGDAGPTLWATAAHVVAAIVGGILTFGYVRQSTVIGQRVLLSLRRRVFHETQRLDLEFHERYTSGRIVSRQTSDMEALRELLDSGIDIMVGSFLSMLFTVLLILGMDWVTGAVMLLMLVPGVLLTVWFQKRSREAYRGIRTHSARLIVHFVEAMTGIRAVKAFRTEERNQATYDDLAQAYRDASLRSIMIFGIYQPSLRILANATIAVVLVVGGFRVLGEICRWACSWPWSSTRAASSSPSTRSPTSTTRSSRRWRRSRRSRRCWPRRPRSVTPRCRPHCPERAARSTSRTPRSDTRRPGRWYSNRSTCTFLQVRRLPSSGEQGPASRRSPSSSPGSTT